MKIMLRKKPGREIPSIVNNSTICSTTVPRFLAEKTPNGIDTASVIAITISPRISVTSTLSERSAETGIEYLIDVPKSPLTKPLIHDTYCSHSGLLVPSCSLRASSFAGDAFVPRIS